MGNIARAQLPRGELRLIGLVLDEQNANRLSRLAVGVDEILVHHGAHYSAFSDPLRLPHSETRNGKLTCPSYGTRDAARIATAQGQSVTGSKRRHCESLLTVPLTGPVHLIHNQSILAPTQKLSF